MSRQKHKSGSPQNPNDVEKNSSHATSSSSPPPTVRRTYLNEEIIHNICEAIANGEPISVSCECEGVPRRTFYSWLERGEVEPDSIYGELFARVARARAQGIRLHLDTLWDPETEPHMVRHCEWWLERRVEDFKPRQEVTKREIKGEEDPHAEFAAIAGKLGMTADELAARLYGDEDEDEDDDE